MVYKLVELFFLTWPWTWKKQLWMWYTKCIKSLLNFKMTVMLKSHRNKNYFSIFLSETISSWNDTVLQRQYNRQTLNDRINLITMHTAQSVYLHEHCPASLKPFSWQCPFLKRQCQRFFIGNFFPWIEPIWAHDKRIKMVFKISAK